MIRGLDEAAAPSKINLFLHVVGRRADGYHLLDSLVVFATIADRLIATEAEDLRLDVSGPFAGMAGAVDDNLVLRAAKALQAEAGMARGAHFRLEKNIPAGAGLGGGSADAARALHLLNKLWGLSLNSSRLATIALKLGADVPVCLHGAPTRMRGIGEDLAPVPLLPSLPIVLVHPGGNLPTRDVFAGLNGRFGPEAPEPPPDLQKPENLINWLQTTRNDLEIPALALRPDIGDALRALRTSENCLLARMSGSGAACFALFSSESAAEDVSNTLKSRHPGWWTCHGLITRPMASMG